MIPTAVPNIGEAERANLLECVETTMVSSAGPFVSRFEDAIAEVSGTGQSVAVSSGTCALHAALVEFGVGHNDLVIVPTLTFIATANAVSHAGATPWLVDVSRDEWTLDLDECERLLETETIPHPDGRLHRKSGRVVKAIMPVLTMGLPLDFATLGQIRNRFGLRVIVDAAAAIGGRFDDKPLGAAPVDAVCFSFNGNKTITSGGGGAIICPDNVRADSLRHLTSTGRRGPDYDHDVIGFNYRMTNVEAAIGVAQIGRLGDFLAKKASISEAYKAFADRHDELGPFPGGRAGASTHWFSGFYYKGDDPEVPHRFREHMSRANIMLRKFWKPLHLQEPYATAPTADNPIATDLWPRIFPLPCSTNLTDEELAAVLSACQEFWVKS